MGIGIRNRKWLILLASITTTTFFVMVITKPTNDYYTPIILEPHSIVFDEKTLLRHTTSSDWRNLTKQESQNLTILGRILFLDEKPPLIINSKKIYQILLWKYGKTIERRHMKHFGKALIDPFNDCPVKNCEITYKDEALKTADLVIFHLHRMSNGEIPNRTSTNQIWAFLTDESPYNTFMKKNSLDNYNKKFNWSMTYRMDSDIPVPYGRTVRREKTNWENFIIFKRRDVLIAIMSSNCKGKNQRWDYVKELQKHIDVHVYGKCGNLKCPGHFESDCPKLDSYLFYLAFENSNCDQYVTEKLWWNAYEKKSIPVVMGGSKESYKKLLPPDSYLHVDDYASPKDLAMHILYLNATGNFQKYYEWKKDFITLNEHGYFKTKSYHYCRVCEALNYNDKKSKTFENLKQFWGPSKWCHPAWNAE